MQKSQSSMGKTVPSLVVLACLVWPLGASGHRLATSKGTWTVDTVDATVTASLTVDVTAVKSVAGLEPPAEIAARPAWRRDHQDAILGAFAGAVAVTLAGTACEPTGLSLEGRSDEDMVVLGIRWQCPRATLGELRLRLGFIEAIGEDHQHMANFGGGDVNLLTVEDPEYRVKFVPDASAEPVADQVVAKVGFGRMVWQGLAHIGTGWDHILFVLALLLGAATLGRAVVIVTAFTVAHSLTLALSVLDVVVLSSRFVEASIAATIVVVAVENIWRDETKHRWAWAFAFGLVHGLGFAGYLKELGMFADGVVWPLLSFNLGVEAGQLVVVGVAFPLMLLAAKKPWWRQAKMAGSGAIAVAGLYWLLERLFAG